MFGFTVAEKEHCYLENEPGGRARMMGAAGSRRGGKSGWITEGKTGLGTGRSCL